jgi:hypothetical protein
VAAHQRHQAQQIATHQRRQAQQMADLPAEEQGLLLLGLKPGSSTFFLPLAAEIINKAAAAQQWHKQQHDEAHAGSSNFDSWRSHAIPSANSSVHLLLFLREEKEDRSQLLDE